MRRFYINSNGRIRRKDNSITFEFEENEETKKRDIPITDIDAIYIFSEVDINTKALNLISQNDITLHIYNYYGFYSGSYVPRKKNISGVLLIDQVKYHIDPESRLYIAVCFIESAIFHIIRNLRKNSLLPEDITELEDNLKKIFEVKTIEEIMAIEGNTRKKYYQLFNKIIKNDDFYFEKRERNPPTNPINAMISFGNSLMYNTVLSEIYKTQLDPTISYLHSPQEKRFSLSLDLAEIFKPLIIDPLIFSLINKKVITKKDFDANLDFAYLSEDGRKKFLKAYEDKLEETIKHRKLNRNVSYRYLIKLECYKLIKHFISDEVYKPFKAWW